MVAIGFLHRGLIPIRTWKSTHDQVRKYFTTSAQVLTGMLQHAKQYLTCHDRKVAVLISMLDLFNESIRDSFLSEQVFVPAGVRFLSVLIISLSNLN